MEDLRGSPRSLQGFNLDSEPAIIGIKTQKNPNCLDYFSQRFNFLSGRLGITLQYGSKITPLRYLYELGSELQMWAARNLAAHICTNLLIVS
jgi:hypothetical protein